MGAALERGAIRPVMRHALSLSWVLSTVAVSIILKNAAVNLWGPEQIKFPSPFGEAVLQIGSAGLFPPGLFILLAPPRPGFSVPVFLRPPPLGQARRAGSFERQRAAGFGGDTSRPG